MAGNPLRAINVLEGLQQAEHPKMLKAYTYMIFKLSYQDLLRFSTAGTYNSVEIVYR